MAARVDLSILSHKVHQTLSTLDASFRGNVGAQLDAKYLQTDSEPINDGIQNHIPFKHRQFPDLRGIVQLPEWASVKNHKVSGRI